MYAERWMHVKRTFREIWSFHERNLKDGTAKGGKKWHIIAVLKNTKLQQVRPLQHTVPVYIKHGSVKGMVKIRIFGIKAQIKVRHGNYIYKQPS